MGCSVSDTGALLQDHLNTCYQKSLFVTQAWAIKTGQPEFRALHKPGYCALMEATAA
jgi:hypothetical protein